MAENKKSAGDKASSSLDADHDPQIPSEIGKKLKSLYDNVVEEEIPDRFLDLLDQLDKSNDKG